MGTGWPGQRHGEAVRAVGGMELVAVADPDETRRAEYVKNLGSMEEYGDYRDMLQKAGLDAVVISLPTQMHARACLESFEAGTHVLCEKPPTTTTREMLQVARNAEKAGLVYMFARQSRFSRASLKARALAVDGRLGRVYHAEAKWMRTRYLPVHGPQAWRVDKDRGGGALLDLGIHALDGVWFVMGCPRPVEVSAGAHCEFGFYMPKGRTYTADDATVGLIRFENGATLQFTAAFNLNWTGPAPVVNGKEAVNTELRKWQVFGSLAGVDLARNLKFTGARRGVRVTQLATPEKRPAKGPLPEMFRQMKDFSDSIRTGKTPENSAAQAVMLMQMLEGLKKSGATGRSVRLSKTAVTA